MEHYNENDKNDSIKNTKNYLIEIFKISVTKEKIITQI